MTTSYTEPHYEERIAAASGDAVHWGARAEAYRRYRQLWALADQEDFLPDHPLHLDIEASDCCNLRCRMCAHGIGSHHGGGLLAYDAGARILDAAAEAGVYAVKFNWRGEPSLNRDLPRLISHAKSAGILEVQFNTHGNAPSPDLYVECAEAGLDRLIFSVDGFSPETYLAVRQGGDYDLACNAIRHIATWRAEHRRALPRLRVQMVRTVMNAHEADAYVAYWKSWVDDVRVTDVMDRGQGDIYFVGDQVTTGRRRCPQPFQRLTIARDGRVSSCCADWNQQFVVGDIKKDTLLSIWHGDKMNALRQAQRELRHHEMPVCNHCYVKESYTWKASANKK